MVSMCLITAKGRGNNTVPLNGELWLPPGHCGFLVFTNKRNLILVGTTGPGQCEEVIYLWYNWHRGIYVALHPGTTHL